jgi:hypothetical protein
MRHVFCKSRRVRDDVLAVNDFAEALVVGAATAPKEY